MEEIAKRSIFVSHAHADRELASALEQFITVAYSGLVRTFVSSSITPGQGISAGDEWYQRIQRELGEAERVWILATPTSVSHPWVYFEAGIGRALCDAGVTPLRVGIKLEDLPSPINQFQSFDGLAPGDRGLKALAADVGAQIGMRIPDFLLDRAVKDWLVVAKSHKPTEGPPDDASVTPEQVDRMEAVLSRFERLTAPDVPRRPARSVEQELIRARVSARLRSRVRLLGVRKYSPPQSFDELMGLVEGAPAGTSFEALEVDSDGDVVIRIFDDADEQRMYVKGDWLEDIPDTSDLSIRAGELILQIEATKRAS